MAASDHIEKAIFHHATRHVFLLHAGWLRTGTAMQQAGYQAGCCAALAHG